MATEVKIKEIFESIQGEGPFVGTKQLFIRFCGCNLNCDYCDTNFDAKDAVSYTADSLIKKIQNDYDLKRIHSVSLTGGEPLLHSQFINEFVHFLHNIKIYLETNATLTDELQKVKDKIDIISADIKLPSSAGKDTFDLHDKFLANCDGIYTFAKIVFDKNITDEKIEICANLGKKHNIELVLQPKMNGDKMTVNNDFCQNTLNKFLNIYTNVRLIPQVHKFLNVR